MPKQEIDANELFNLALSIVGLIVRDGSMAVADLAEHFGVSKNAITKAVQVIVNSEDISKFETHFDSQDWLLEEGEVSFSPGRGNLTMPPVLSQRQVVALGTGLDYLASLPSFSGNSDLQELRSALTLTPSGSSAPSQVRENSELEKLRVAISGGVAISCEYRNQLGERSSRVIDPLRIDFLGKRHYLRGWCHTSKSVRSFRLDRILALSVLETKISQAAKDAEISESIYGDEIEQLEVKIAAKPEAAEIFWNFPAVTKPLLDGGEVIGTIQIGNLESLGRHITRYGGLARVLEPAEARQAVAAFALRALKGFEHPEDED